MKVDRGGNKWAKRTGKTSVAVLSVKRMSLILAGLVLLVLALPPFFDFPWLHFWFVPLALIYLFLLLLLPRLWLIVLPLVTVGVDITPFTGRFTYNELDLAFLVTIASGLLYGRYRLRVFALRPSTLVLCAYLVVVAFGYSGWMYFLIPPGTELDNPYYSEGYAYKTMKGMVWGIALVPMWGYLLAVDKQRTVFAMVAGMSAAALVLCLVVLWERGTVGVLLNGSAWYHWVSSLLDLSSSYRVTGILSDMHTGGEAIDGVLLLLLPATLYAATYGRLTWLRTLGAAGFAALAYVTLVGYTRSTYVAFAIAVAVFCLFTLWTRWRNGIAPPVPLVDSVAVLCVGLISALVTYRLAGSAGLASYGALLALAFTQRMRQFPSWVNPVAYALSAAIIAWALYAHGASRWVQFSYVGALGVGLSLLAVYMLGLRLFEKTKSEAAVDRAFLLAGIILLPMIFSFALGGYQINDRVSRTTSDFDTRKDHWESVIESAAGGLWPALIGNGTGSFPARYIGRHPEYVQDVGSYGVITEQNRDVLRLGGGDDLTLGQRVTVEPHTLYTVGIYLKAEESARLIVRLCERNLIYASNFSPRCEVGTIFVEPTDDGFEKYAIEINSGRVGDRGSLGRWPTVMTMDYRKAESVVEIDAIELSADGFNILRNSSFKQGLDYWYSYNDFSHLPWHIKNTYLQLWFDHGWLGLALFLAMVVLLVSKNFRNHAHDSLVPLYTTAVLVICVFGLFGSPLDSARVSWLFYFFLAAGLAELRVKKRGRRHGGHRPA